MIMPTNDYHHEALFINQSDIEFTKGSSDSNLVVIQIIYPVEFVSLLHH